MVASRASRALDGRRTGVHGGFLLEAKPPYRAQWRRAKPKFAPKRLKKRSPAIFVLDQRSNGTATPSGEGRPSR